MKNSTAPPMHTSGYPIMSLPPQKFKLQNLPPTITGNRSKIKHLTVNKPDIADSPHNWDEHWFGNYE